ncbi:hypothetical protein BGX23_002979, partial [Mortierella sp. AD031]
MAMPNSPPATPKSTAAPNSASSRTTALPLLSEAPMTVQQPWLSTFPQNVTAPTSSTVLPPPGTRFETTAQLTYCNNLLRKYLSPSSTAETVMDSFDASQIAVIKPYAQDEEEATRVRWLATRVVEEFAAESTKVSTTISEVVLLAPSLDKEYYRKLLNCMIAEFEKMSLLDVELLQGMVQLVQCAEPDYLNPDDLVRILVILRTRLEGTHQQTADHPYHLTLALSRLLDVMVEGKVQDLSRVTDHEPLSALLDGLSGSDDLFLKHQAKYAMQ